MKKFIVLVFSSLLFFGGCTEKEKSNKENHIIAVATYVDYVVLNKIRDSFVQKLYDLGYTKDNNWTIIIKSANGQLNEATIVADELLNMNPKVIVSISTPSTKPIYDRNQGKIPHVYSFVSFPKSIGITDDIKNITGLSDGINFKKNFEFMQQIIPNIKKIGMVFSDEPNAIVSKNEIMKLCKDNNIKFIGQSISKEEEIKSAVQSIVTNNVDVIFVGADGVVVNQINAMIEVANAYKIPLFSVDEGSVENGALAALSVNYTKFGKETALLTHQVINKGNANIKQKTFYGNDIVINLKTANKIGIKISENIIQKSYKVIKE